MIHDILLNFAHYCALHPRFEAIAQWLRQTALDALPLGRHEILPNGEAFVNVQEIAPRPMEEIPAEYHRKYIDIQIPLSGIEQMGWQPLSKFPVDVEFSTERDVALAKSPTRDWLSVAPGEFVVFFPTDVHTPGLVSSPHRKIIVKVLR
ncbi:MAG: YhcH/YjgK/YiaL family protein [Victivallales bacterium]|nr:YhcH/YjgK/YiaL family protein [Victivallales bacterium]